MNQWLGPYASLQQERLSPQPGLRAPRASRVVTLRYLNLPSSSPPTALPACRGFPSRFLSLGLPFSLSSLTVSPASPPHPSSRGLRGKQFLRKYKGQTSGRNCAEFHLSVGYASSSSYFPQILIYPHPYLHLRIFF